MNYWLMKTEPGTYAWEDLVKDKKTVWDGVRNFQARNNLSAMKKGDRAFIYHSMSDKAIIGIAKISKEGYPDPKDKAWVVVDIVPEKVLKKAITLADIKANKKYAEYSLVREPRLSVMPVPKKFWDDFMKMGG